MRILLTSVPFAPSIGGIESVSAVLAEEFARAGHVVAVATQTAAGETAAPQPAASAAPAYRILRRPDARTLLRAYADADVVLQNNVSLRLGWPLLLRPRTPCVVAHHVWIPRTGRAAFAGGAKRVLLRFARNVAVSRAIAAELPVPATIVANPYDERRFRALPGIARDGELAFLGRLVSDKGLPVLLDALGQLASRRRAPTLTVIGDGPDRDALAAQAARLGIDAHVRFAGALRGEALVAELHRHRVLVVPSLWEEPFGVVVLEALACGLVPIVARSGGLPDAVGPCGLVVPKGDAHSLADAIVAVLDDATLRARLEAGRAVHLAQHAPARVARAYLDVLERAVRERNASRTASAPRQRGERRSMIARLVRLARLAVQAILLPLPWWLRRPLLVRCFGYRIDRSARIGLAWVYPARLVMGPAAPSGT